MEDTMKTLISFYDTFKNLINIYEIFPENFTLPLACFVDVQ